MFRSTKAKLAVALSAAAVAAVPASAQAQADQQGLANVAISDVTVQLPIGVAANVCNIPVAVLAQQIALGEPCTAVADPDATNGGGGQDGRTRQRGLVNVFADDITIQLPIGIAANVCNVPIAVLANQAAGGRTCEAVAAPNAEN